MAIYELIIFSVVMLSGLGRYDRVSKLILTYQSLSTDVLTTPVSPHTYNEVEAAYLLEELMSLSRVGCFERHI
jgi:hypothetical protein